VEQRKSQRKWLLVGALIYGATLLNALRFVRALPVWVVAVGIAVNLFMFVGFLKLYFSAKQKP
jgi:hypothetical protein